MCVDIKEEQVESENDPDEEEMDDVNKDDEMECHWRNVFEDNEGSVDNKKKGEIPNIYLRVLARRDNAAASCCLARHLYRNTL